MHNQATEDDFVPPAIIDEDFAPIVPCKRFALSFFKDVDSAREYFRTKLATREDAAARYGDCIGEIDLLISDGLLSEPDLKGHMDLHQEDGVIFAQRVRGYHAL